MDNWRLLRYADPNSDTNANANANADTYAYADSNTNANANARFCVQPIQGRHGRCQLEHRWHAKHCNRHIAACYQRHAGA